MDSTNIDKAYDEMLNIADKISKEGMSEETANRLNVLANNVNDMPMDIDSIDEEINKVELPEIDPNKEVEPVDAIGIYDQKTGEIKVAEDTTREKLAQISERHWNSFTNDGHEEEVNQDLLKALFTEEDLKEINDFSMITNLVKRWNAGERFNPYDEFPDRMKSIVDEVVAKSNTPVDKNTRGFIAKGILDELSRQYRSIARSDMDLDTMLAGFDKELRETMDSMSKEVGNMMISFDEERKIEIDAAIERCKAEGKEDSIAKLEAMKETLDKAYKLDELKEYCKHARIKKFDMEKPKRIYDSFNAKYIKHKNNINDISICSDILDRHFIGYERENIMLCLAFCKYAMNMSPDNITEHTFMYYFIRNIIAMDRLNPKGNLYESMDERSKVFYDGFHANILECLDILKEK